MGEKDHSPASSSNDEQLTDLVLGHLDQRLSDDEFAELQHLLQSDPSARARYEKLARLDSNLGDNFDFIGDELQPVAAVSSSPGWSSRQVLAIAAVIAILAIAGSMPFRNGGSDGDNDFARASSPTEVTRGVAVITAESAAQWHSEKELGLSEGRPLPPGRYTLQKGLAQIDFYGGASISLSGPAEIELIDADTAVLHRGRIRADVPPAARGFEIHAAEMRIEDLGTSFGLAVGDDSQADVIVFDGEVRTIDDNGDTISLYGGDAAHLSQGKASPLDSAELGEFPTIADVVAGSDDRDESRYSAWKQYSQRRRTDPRLIAYYDFEDLDLTSRRLANRATVDGENASELDGGIVGARVAEGRWSQKTALDFRLEGDRVRFKIPGEFDALTLFVWVRIDALDRHLNSLFLTDYFDPNEIHWQVSKKGALHFATSPKGVVDIPKHNRRFYSDEFWKPGMSGQWLMLSTSVDRSAASGQNVTHYVNGEAVGFSGGTQMHKELPRMRIGSADLGNWSDPIWPEVSIRTLNGRIDEFGLYRVALSAEEIEDIYQQGKP